MLTALLAGFAFATQSPRIHCVSDISQEFTFYMDGRFYKQYIGENGSDERNWGTLWKLGMSNTNLLVLASGDTRVPYTQKTVSFVKNYVQNGGGLLVLGDANAVPEGKTLPLQAVADAFDVHFEREAAATPLTGKAITIQSKIDFYGGGTLRLDAPFETLVQDAAGKPVLARRKFGKGNVMIGIRGLFGNRPDATDPINASWISPLLLDVVKGKPVNPSQPIKGQWAELTKQVGPLTLEFHEGTAKYADAIAKEYTAIRPHLIEITGVEPSSGMITRMLMLPTGGGGFSSGERIAIGAWWGDYPNHRYPMVELISHEAGHSWVLPHPEPVWNEPIATYLGILVGRRMKMPEADETLKNAIERARKEDPNLDKIDINKPGAPNAVVWGKTYYIFEELERKYGPGVMAKYFRTKRKLVAPSHKGYSMDDCVAVWSAAVGHDLFSWFRSLGIDVDHSRTDLFQKGRN